MTIRKLTMTIGYDDKTKTWFTTGKCDFCKCFPCGHIEMQKLFLGIKGRRLRINYKGLEEQVKITP